MSSKSLARRDKSDLTVFEMHLIDYRVSYHKIEYEVLQTIVSNDMFHFHGDYFKRILTFRSDTTDTPSWTTSL